LVIGVNVVAILGALVGAGALAYAKNTVGDIQRTADLRGDVLASLEDLPPGEPQNFLIVGVDDDEGLPDDDPVTNNRDRETQGSLHSDTIMVVRVDPSTTDVKVLSFPRDLLVEIPGRSGRTRINAALAYGDGNPGLLVETIKHNFAIDVHHYVQVNFAGFKSLVKIIGGVPIWFPTPVRDRNSGLLVENPGCTYLDENGSLAYARSRKFQYMNERGRWQGDGSNDYGRIRRQQDFVRRVIHRAISKGARNPVVLSQMVDTGVEHITLDPNTTPADLITLGRAFRTFDPDKLGTSSLVVREVTRGGAAVLELVEKESEPILAQFRSPGSDSSDDVLPSSVRVRVLNGTGVQDQASDLTDRFEDVGFAVASPASSELVWVTEVRYPPGYDTEAHLVARHLDGDPQLVADDDVEEVVVVTGPDLVGVLDEPRPAAAVPTTTTTTTTSTTTTTRPITTTTVDDDDEGDDGDDSEPTVSVPLVEGVGPAGEGTAYVPGGPPEGESCG
jgi:LCP family protein required for cell wall assembly